MLKIRVGECLLSGEASTKGLLLAMPSGRGCGRLSLWGTPPIHFNACMIVGESMTTVPYPREMTCKQHETEPNPIPTNSQLEITRPPLAVHPLPITGCEPSSEKALAFLHTGSEAKISLWCPFRYTKRAYVLMIALYSEQEFRRLPSHPMLCTVDICVQVADDEYLLPNH